MYAITLHGSEPPMPHPATTAHRYTEAWHADQEADERAWLDDWARLHLISITSEPEHAAQGPVRALTAAGRP